MGRDVDTIRISDSKSGITIEETCVDISSHYLGISKRPILRGVLVHLDVKEIGRFATTGAVATSVLASYKPCIGKSYMETECARIGIYQR